MEPVNFHVYHFWNHWIQTHCAGPDFNIYVCTSLRRRSCPTSNFHHIQSSRSPVRLLLSEAKPSYVHILNFKATWSEFQKASQTVTKQDKAKFHILKFKTTLSEFQKPCQTVAMEGKAELHIYNLINTNSSDSVRRSCVRQHT